VGSERKSREEILNHIAAIEETAGAGCARKLFEDLRQLLT